MPILPGGLVWLASYPKSGNTWMRVLLSNLMAGTDGPEDINNLSLQDSIASSRATFEEETLVDSHLLLPREIEGLRAAVHTARAASACASVVKVHDAWGRLPDGTPLLGRAARAALYLVRDPRDIAVSFAFHMAVSVDEAIERMNRPDACLGACDSQVRQRLGDWSGHIRGWLNQTDVPVHLVRYEDLLADTPGVFGRALIFLGVHFETETAGREAIARAVRHADFAELHRQEREKGFRERRKNCDLCGREELFFRRGQAGDWRRHLTDEQVLRIEDAHAATMTSLGYELVTSREIAL